MLPSQAKIFIYFDIVHFDKLFSISELDAAEHADIAESSTGQPVRQQCSSYCIEPIIWYPVSPSINLDCLLPDNSQAKTAATGVCMLIMWFYCVGFYIDIGQCI